MNTGHSSFAIDFGQDGNSHLFRKEGWSEPEPRYTWTTGLASSLELPRPEEPGEYLLELNVHPFISDGKISSQKLRVMINDAEVGDFDIRVTSSLECLLPWDLLKADSSVSVKFAHPFAASRRAINGEADERLIALAFQRIRLRKLQEAGDEAARTMPPGHADLRALPTTGAPPALEGHVDVYGYYPSTRCWVFVGWTSCAWTEDDLPAITVRFDDRDASGPVATGFYERPGLRGRGQGFVLTMPATPRKRQLTKSRLSSLQVEAARFSLTIDGHANAPVGAEQLDRVLRPILANAPRDDGLAVLRAHLPGDLIAALPNARFDGHIDLYGYDRSLGGWLFLGWLTQPWAEGDRPNAVARFAGREVSDELSGAFYERGDVRGRGFGCLLFLPDTIANEGPLPALQSLEIGAGDTWRRLEGPTLEAASLPDLMVAVQPLLDSAPAGSGLAQFSSLLGQDTEPTALPMAFEGYIDFCGYHAGVEGWVFCGWVTSPWVDSDAPTAIAQFVDGDISGAARATFYHRDDIRERGVGVVFLVLSDADRREQLLSVKIEFPAFTTTIPASGRPAYSERQLLTALRPILFEDELQPDSDGLRRLLLDDDVAAAPPVPARPARPIRLDGHVDLYGYHPEASGWFFCGWVAKPWGDADRPGVTARFQHGSVSSETMLAAFYYRGDIESRGVGFILSLASPDADRGHLVSLELGSADFTGSLRTTASDPGLAPHDLVERLAPLLTGGEANSNRARLQAMLRPAAEAASVSSSAPQGFIDVYGYHTVAGGWLFCGWVSDEAEDIASSPNVIVQFERGAVRGEGVRVNYPREDLGGRGLGVVLFISGSGSPLGGLLSVTIEAADLSYRIYPGSSIRRLREQELVSQLRGIVAGATAGLSRDVMLSVLGRQGFSGADTVGELSDRIFFEFDEAIICEPDGIVLIGWHLAKPGIVRHIRLRSGPLVSTIDLDDGLRVERPDVLSAVEAEHGFDDSRCGFIVFLPHAVDPASPPYVEIETRRGELAYRVLPSRRLGSMAAIRRLLECFDVRFLDVPRAYDRVIGPAVELLNRGRLKVRPTVTAVEFGTPPADPEFSVIVPLYGRIDFVEYQIALFSAYAANHGVEFIYLLDDPPKRREAQFLFTSIYERFRLPFRALLFDRNVGFAPTNNIGLQHARGRYVCFLNSDAFPGTDDWLERLAQRLTQNPELGAVGPLLLYEDGSIQHQGMSFRRLNEFGGWYFGHHPGKGMHLADAKGMRRCISITGACMLLRRDLAERLHGFDESYAIGDFEDSDLCLRLYRMGLACAVDLDVHLFHLERKSQAGSAANWRMNLTLYNAWFHERRWAGAIAAHPQASAPVPFGDDTATEPQRYG